MCSLGLNAQVDSLTNSQGNTGRLWLDQTKGKLFIGGYGEVHYNQYFNGDIKKNSKVDVHRMVMLFGYKFTPKWSFVTEIEYEHVNEVFVEQAFVNYRHSSLLNFTGGLLLIPMGIVNEYHEPTTFNGVERPFLDNAIVPSTWREIGLGITGNAIDYSLRYQLYLVNGFSSFDDGAKLGGSKGLRSGRQKGAEAMFTANLTGKLTYYGVRGLKLGASFYTGKTSSSLNSYNVNDALAAAQADSSVVNVTMLGLDARYDINGLHLRGQYNLVNIGGSQEYNTFTGASLGKTLSGYYVEAGYNLFRNTNYSNQLIPFVRYEKYDTHASVEGDLVEDMAYDRTAITTGLTYKISDAISLKSDYQFLTNASSDEWTGQLNFGIGVWFR